MKSILDTKYVNNKTINYRELIEHIYINNDEKRFILQTPTLENNKELYCFCLDLFCKGLITLYGNTQGSVEVNKLSMDDIQIVIDKLSYGGIMTVIQIEKSVDECSDIPEHEVLKESMALLHAYADNAPLCDFRFRLKVNTIIYVIKFEIRI
jgi:hypothetical protein